MGDLVLLSPTDPRVIILLWLEAFGATSHNKLVAVVEAEDLEGEGKATMRSIGLALRELEDAGAIVGDDDGWSFPWFRKWRLA